MQIPPQIKILGRMYKVEFVELPDTDGEPTFGESCNYNRYIKINSNIKDDELILDTFIHEIAHQILKLCGITQLMQEDLEEAICEAIGAGLCSVLVDNASE